MNGEGSLSSTVTSVISQSQELLGEGRLTSDGLDTVCTAKKLIKTAIGSGPLYDITIDGEVDEFQKQFLDNDGTEAIIEYPRTLGTEPLDIAIGNEVFWLSPSLYDPNYTKQADLTEDVLREPEVLNFNSRFLAINSKMSGDGKTLAVLFSESASSQYSPHDLKIILYRRYGDQWNLYKSIDYIRANSYISKNERNYTLDINYNGEVVVFCNQKESISFGQSDIGVCHVYSFDETQEEYIRIDKNQITGTENGSLLGVDVSVNNDGDVIAVSETTSSISPYYKGRIAVYRKVGQDWIKDSMDYLINTSGATYNLYGVNAFGQCLSLSGDGKRLVVLNIKEYNHRNNCKATINVYDYVEVEGIFEWRLNEELSVFPFSAALPYQYESSYLMDGKYNGVSFDLSISSDGSTIAFGAADPYDDAAGGNRFSGKIQTYRYISGSWTKFSSNITIDPDPIEASLLAANTDFHLGKKIELSSDGTKLLAYQQESVCVYEIVQLYYGYYTWNKVSQVYPYDCPEKQTFVYPIQSIGFSDDGQYVNILIDYATVKDGFSTLFFQSMPPEKRYANSVYKIDYTKTIDRLDYDNLNTNYLEWSRATISCQDENGYRHIQPTLLPPDYEIGWAGLSSAVYSQLNTSRDMSFSFFYKRPSSVNSNHKIFDLAAQNFSGSYFAQSFFLLYTPSSNSFHFNRFYLNENDDNWYVDNNYYFSLGQPTDEWQHYVLTIRGNVSIDLYENGVLIGSEPIKFKPEIILSSFNLLTGHDSYDDVRVFDSVLTHNQIKSLASHRISLEVIDTYYYDYLGESNGTIHLEYLRSTYKDLPIKDFCVNQTIDDCGNQDCVIDAEIKFCYLSDLPNILPIFDLQTVGISGIGLLESDSDSLPLLQVEQYHSKDLIGQGLIYGHTIAAYSMSEEITSQGDLTTGFVDKYNGDLFDLSCVQKLYPSSDISNVGFTSSDNDSVLFPKINEGVYEGDWKTDSTRISDDSNSYIQLIAPDTKGSFSYKCGITNTLVDPEESLIRFRMSGPTSTFDCSVPPRYTISNIRLEDPQGTLIVQYEDIVFIGDSDFSEDVNYTTVVRSEKTNNVKGFYRWQDNYPVLDSGNAPNGFSLSFDVVAEDLGAEFTLGYNEGFKEDTTRTSSQQLNHALRISAIEICSSGRLSNYQEHFINLMTPVVDTGRRIEKCFYPTFFPSYDYDTGVWPSVSSVWSANGDSSLSNQTAVGSAELLQSLRDLDENYFATLDSMGPVANSGKLTIRFGHSIKSKNEITSGPFHDAFGEGRNKRDNIWFSPSGAFAGLERKQEDIDSEYFLFDSITLKVLAKKAIGSRDYNLDVVGYSDDCLLNVTSSVGGFLQNASGINIVDHSTDSISVIGSQGSIPTTSGFNDIDDLGISTEAISDKNQYFESTTTNNAGGDHYLVAQYPTVNSTDFQWYEIPLKVYEDDVELGRSKKYNISTLLEKLYLDIYPLPTGASIANIHLCVRYAPQNAFNLSSQGGEFIRAIQDGRSEGSFYPISRQTNDQIINAGSGYGPLSYISGIPQAYTTPDSIKSNYSRRWRGMEGTVQGPYDVDQFGFGFSNPLLDYPFVSGFYLFEDSSTTISPTVGSLEGTLITTYSEYQFTNIGWRFSNKELFADFLPGFSSDYTTTDWTALSNGATNFQDHELYGQIADAFKNVVRISGHNSSINFGDLDYGSQGDNGLSIYTRFTPDANVSGVGYNLFESGVLVSKWDSGQDMEFCLAYSGGYLAARAKDATSGGIKEVYDTVLYSGYQFPLSVIMTYNDDGSHKLKLYTDNEFESNWTTLRGQSDSFYIDTNTSNLVVGNSTGSGVGFNMFLAEFGISSGNIVESNPDATLKQVTAQKFLENNRVHWWDASDSTTDDSYKLWDYVNENTDTDWNIGAFKYCPFNFEFDSLGSSKGKRTGRDLINFTINHHGSGYSQYTDILLPQSVDSGVSYHTQIENDFLRLHLSDTSDNFYSAHRRISKNLPHGYDFAERSLVVETVLEHQSASNNILWEDGSVGPKLIVSLYTKTKEPKRPLVEPFTESNWGLVNRDIHYLEPSSCMMRVDSKFTYGSYCDKSENWALFPHEPRMSEFTEKYFSADVDDMFLQYDLVYPSGPAFDSRIDIHTSHVRADDALVNATHNSGTLNINVSGDPSPVTGLLDLHLFSASGSAGSLNLTTLGPVNISDSGFILYTSGELISTNQLQLFVDSHDLIKESGFNLIASGDGRTFTGTDSLPLPMFVYGKDYTSGTLPLSVFNSDQVGQPDGPVLPLSIFAASGAVGVRDFMPVYMLQNFANEPGPKSGTLDLQIIGAAQLASRFRNASMNLSLSGPDRLPLSQNMNITLYGDNLSQVVSTGSMNLYSSNYLGFNTPFYLWFNNNYGTGISLEDNNVASISVSDEIRGVDLFGYGSCTGDSPRKAIDAAVITDDSVWRKEKCNEGGIFRATSTYTNESAGYSGNYYGIRKIQGLAPNAPYMTTLNIKTGNTDAIKTPRDWQEWGYGTCGPDTVGDCCPDDCTDNINFSGVKMIGDYPYLSGDPSITEADGRLAEDNYGRAVATKKDLIAIGSPNHQLRDEEGTLLDNAGAVFLYRRGIDVAGLKADWQLEDKITLPSGYKKDYISKTYQNLICYPSNTNKEFCISGQQWNIGQEGRQFGYSLDLASDGEREMLVVGAPDAAWSRTFDEITTSGIPVLMVVFTDQFSYNKNKIAAISNTASKYDILYKYFAAPWDLGAGEFQPQLDIKLLVCQLYDSDQVDNLPIVNPKESWFNHIYINNLLDVNQSSAVLLNEAVSGIKNKFLEMFPHGDALYSGIPPIVGVFGDNSSSTYNKATFQPALDEFLSFYQDHAYASGLEDLTDNTPQSGYIKQIYSNSFGWDQDSVKLLNETLSTGNLLTQSQLEFPSYNFAGNPVMNYIASGVGQEWAQENAYEFQIPPESGGRVFVFEKEKDTFNLVQELISPEEELKVFEGDDYDDSYGEGSLPYGIKENDRFGHSVSISNNSEVIAVGSPYSSEVCRIYERDETENTRMYGKLREWLEFRSLTSEVIRYNDLLSVSGTTTVQETVYNELNPSNKFLLRTDNLFWGQGNTIQLYKKVYKYHHNDIPYIGTWGFIPQEFAGTSRLGYSSAVSESGDVVAFGAPTDSFNEFDDYNAWYRSENSWASYSQAGAVRVFESRKYFPHNKAVEYTRFGNLDRSVHATGDIAPFYDQMGLYFQPDKVPFERLPFSEIEIPQDAGLAFIITPEINAASDEIIDNLKSWLALGDRTLVLVGNDPVWEENGLYSESNKIVNDVLKKLGSRMRIHPARNQYESLVAGVSEQDYNNDKYNITRAFVPEYIHDTHVNNGNVFASGVGDIRIDLSDLDLEDLKLHSPCDKINDKCEHTIQHLGDLRAEWDSECVVIGPPNGKIEYKTNWPFHFNNPNPAQQCSFWPQNPKPYVNRPGEAIRPILTAAEHITPPLIVVPASSGSNEECTTELSGIIRTEYTTGSKIYSFDDNQVDEVAFSISQASGNFMSGIFSDFERGGFLDPEKFDSRNAFAQAAGTSYLEDVPPKTEVVSPDSVWATEETYFNDTIETTSKVILMASMQAETDFALGKKSGYDPNNKDQNMEFYNNLVMKDCNSAGDIVQLGGWTGRDSFKDAFEDSSILKVFQQGGHTVSSGVTYSDSDSISILHNVLWIADPVGKPSDLDITRIKNWMNTGDKKVVITYSNSQERANNVDYICEKLELNTKPYYSAAKGSYFVQDTELIANGNTQSIPYDTTGGFEPIQIIDETSFVFQGCSTGYAFNPISSSTQVEKLAIIPNNANPFNGYESEVDIEQGFTDYVYIPIKAGNNTKKLVTYLAPLTEQRYQNPHTYWKIDAKSTIDFDVTENSGYKMFVNWVSESPDEKYDISMNIDDVSFSAYPSDRDESGDGSPDLDPKKLTRTSTYSPNSLEIDFRVPSGVSKVSLNFDTKEWTRLKSADFNGNRPLTPRILSVSGCLLPINVETITNTVVKERKIYITTCSGVPWYIPEETIQRPSEFRPIKTLNNKYCGPDACDGYDNKLIEDGPVVVADELEHFTTFNAGRNRSRIVVVSDSTIVQGQSPYFRNDALQENQNFIRSMYPISPEKYKDTDFSDQDLTLGNAARKFSFTQKLLAPERGSAAKYYAVSGLSKLVERYTLGGSYGSLENYTSSENDKNPGDIYREFTPETKEKRDTEIELFGSTVASSYGVFPRYSGIIDGKLYIDAGLAGGKPEFMVDKKKDYIDFDMLGSGFAGDLFGVSVDIHEDKLIVGTPFNGFLGEDIQSWSGIYNLNESGAVGSGLKLSGNGGAGAAFYYERTGRGENVVSSFLPWEFQQKIKPSSINVGIDNSTITMLREQKAHEPVSLLGSFVANNAMMTDRFGYSVSIDSDFIAVGAPAHDFETIHTHLYSGSTAFIRKEFGNEFDIPQHEFHDLGSSGVRIDDFNKDSGKMVLNNGAVFTYRHKMTNWENRSKEWVYAEKINAQGYSDRNNIAMTGCENDFFGFSVGIDRARRGDSDYVLVAGAPNHNYSTSGQHPTQELENAGASYTFDAMLREQLPSIPNSESYIDAQVFGHKPESQTDRLRSVVQQNITGGSQLSSISGLVFANENGDIFLEVSGFDPSTKGFVEHRPYVELIQGELVVGTQNSETFNLLTSGKPVDVSGDMNLFIVGPDSDIVYNNVNLYSFGASGVSSGNMPMFLSVPSGYTNDSLNLNLTSTQVIGSLNLRTRGK